MSRAPYLSEQKALQNFKRLIENMKMKFTKRCMYFIMNTSTHYILLIVNLNLHSNTIN